MDSDQHAEKNRMLSRQLARELTEGEMADVSGMKFSHLVTYAPDEPMGWG